MARETTECARGATGVRCNDIGFVMPRIGEAAANREVSKKRFAKAATVRARCILFTVSLALVIGACSDESESERAVLPNIPAQPAHVGASGFDLEAMDRAADRPYLAPEARVSIW